MLPGLPKLDHRGPFLGLGSDEFAQIRRRALIRHAPQRRVPRSHIRIGQDRIDPGVELLDDLDWRALRRADAPRCAGLVTRHEFANGRQLGERRGACGRRHRQGPQLASPAHRARRIGLRPRDPRNSRQRGSARCQVQESTAGKFRIALTASSRNFRGCSVCERGTDIRCVNRL
jgi:hypothetical protein